MRASERGQATVELALCLPILAVLLGVVVEIAMLGGDQVRLWHASREAARAAVVDPDPAAARTAAERSGLQNLRIAIDPDPAYRVQGQPLRVEVSMNPQGTIPLIGSFFEQLELHASAAMRIEEP
jgi:Flp pilus assembly protein TadG